MGIPIEARHSPSCRYPTVDGNGRWRLAVVATGALLAAVATSASEPQAPGWRCAASTATAYQRDPARNRWLTLVLPVAGQSFVVQPGTATPWQLVWEGGDGTVLACAGDFGPDGELRCGGEQLFTLDRDTRMFTSRVFGAAERALGDLAAATIVGSCQAL